MDQYDLRLTSINGISYALMVVIGVNIAISIGIRIFLSLLPGEEGGFGNDYLDWVLKGTIADNLSLLIGAIVFAFWLNRSYENLSRIGLPGLDYNSRSVGWNLFIPFVNFYIPMHAMQQIWVGSQFRSQHSRLTEHWKSDRSSSIVVGWWICFWLGLIGPRIVQMLFGIMGTGFAVAHGIVGTSWLVSGGLLIYMVNKVRLGQEELLSGNQQVMGEEEF